MSFSRAELGWASVLRKPNLCWAALVCCSEECSIVPSSLQMVCMPTLSLGVQVVAPGSSIWLPALCCSATYVYLQPIGRLTMSLHC